MKTVDRLREDWMLSTEISKLESRLWRRTRRENLQTVLVTSAVRGEGKTTTVAYLATALGLYPERRILTMDFDFRVPSLNHHFGLKVHRGIDQVLAGECLLREAIIETGLPSLHLAFPRERGADPSLLLATQRLAEMIDALRADYDLILMDTPAVIPVADSLMLMPLADGVILAGMAGKTTEPQLRRAREICEGMDVNMLGLVVGNIKEAAPEYLADDHNYNGYYVAGSAKRSPSGGKTTSK